MIGAMYEEEGKKITAILKGLPCSWNRCSYCCFYEEAAKDLDDLMATLKEVLAKIKEITGAHEVERMVIFNGGSFFELPLTAILEMAQVTEGKAVEIESRPEFITAEGIVHLLSILKPNELIIRIGLESMSATIRNELLKKGVNDGEVRRVVKLRREVKKGLDGIVNFVAYQLFGMEGIDEESVILSANEFNKRFDGVIAIKYRRYREWMPRVSVVSPHLLEFLRQNCLDVDLADSEIWEIG